MYGLHKKENTLYVVATKPRFSSMIHEYLHLSFEPYRSYMADLYKSYKGAPLFDENKLSDLGYMWDDDLDSELRGLEEGFVRSITVLISTLTDEEKKIELELLRDEGFILADKLISYIAVKVKEENLKELIKFTFKY